MKSIKNMVRSLLRFARTTKAGDDTGDFPVQQVGYLAKVGDTVMWFPYGMHANIPADELVLMVSMQGNPEARVSIPGSPQKRVKPLAASEVVFFHPSTGSKLHFKANGDIEIMSTKDAAITVAGDAAINVEGKASFGVGTVLELGEVGAVKKLVHEEFITLFNSHTHKQSGGSLSTFAPEIPAVIDTHTTTKTRGDD
jgi:hypothetical protein